MPLVQASDALAVAQANIDELQQQLTAAEEARDEFVDLLSPKKAPRPAGSPAPKATESQLRAALKVCPFHFSLSVCMFECSGLCPRKCESCLSVCVCDLACASATH